MKAEKWFAGQIEKYKDDLEFRTEGVILEFTEKIVAKMEEKNISRSALAKKLGVSKAFISKLLNGNPNLTIKSMMSIADALGCDLNLDIYPRGFEVRNFYIHDNKQTDAKKFTRNVTPVVGEATDAIAA